MDRQINIGVTSMAAWVLWALSFALWFVAWGTRSPDVGRLSLLVCGVAATATFRALLITQSERIKAAMVAMQASETVRRMR